MKHDVDLEQVKYPAPDAERKDRILGDRRGEGVTGRQKKFVGFCTVQAQGERKLHGRTFGNRPLRIGYDGGPCSPVYPGGGVHGGCVPVTPVADMPDEKVRSGFRDRRLTN